MVLCYGKDLRQHNILRASYFVMFSTEIHTLNSMITTRLTVQGDEKIYFFYFLSLERVYNIGTILR